MYQEKIIFIWLSLVLTFLTITSTEDINENSINCGIFQKRGKRMNVNINPMFVKKY